MIWEPMGDPRPSDKDGMDMVSSSRPEAIWQPNFKFGDGPLPASMLGPKAKGGGWPKAWCTASYCLRTFSYSRT